MITDWKRIARIETQYRTGGCNGGWAYDAYPELETLDARRTITIAEIKGPAVITCIHITRLFHDGDFMPAARGVILEVYYNDAEMPAVRVPFSDFFADGCLGKAEHFSSLFVEKAPESYNCFIPMPFEKSARVVLRNETDYNFWCYSFIEYEEIPCWDNDLGYFHATWSRSAFQLSPDTDRLFFHAEGKGHLLGRAWSICTDEPFFEDFSFVMEGNNEIWIDGEDKPRLDYLGTEDSFAFSWGFGKVFTGPYNGMNYIAGKTPSLLSIYRFHGSNVIRFNKSFDLRIDWSHESPGPDGEANRNKIKELCDKGHGWVDYATTFYWYQNACGYRHQPLPSMEDRNKPVMKPRKGMETE